MTASCGTCRYYLQLDNHGICRRNPPTPFMQNGFTATGPATIRSEFPPMQLQGWCGEFATKETVQ